MRISQKQIKNMPATTLKEVEKKRAAQQRLDQVVADVEQFESRVNQVRKADETEKDQSLDVKDVVVQVSGDKSSGTYSLVEADFRGGQTQVNFREQEGLQVDKDLQVHGDDQSMTYMVSSVDSSNAAEGPQYSYREIRVSQKDGETIYDLSQGEGSWSRRWQGLKSGLQATGGSFSVALSFLRNLDVLAPLKYIPNKIGEYRNNAAKERALAAKEKSLFAERITQEVEATVQARYEKEGAELVNARVEKKLEARVEKEATIKADALLDSKVEEAAERQAARRFKAEGRALAEALAEEKIKTRVERKAGPMAEVIFEERLEQAAHTIADQKFADEGESLVKARAEEKIRAKVEKQATPLANSIFETRLQEQAQAKADERFAQVGDSLVEIRAERMIKEKVEAEASVLSKKRYDKRVAEEANEKFRIKWSNGGEKLAEARAEAFLKVEVDKKVGKVYHERFDQAVEQRVDEMIAFRPKVFEARVEEAYQKRADLKADERVASTAPHEKFRRASASEINAQGSALVGKGRFSAFRGEYDTQRQIADHMLKVVNHRPIKAKDSDYLRGLAGKLKSLAASEKTDRIILGEALAITPHLGSFTADFSPLESPSFVKKYCRPFDSRRTHGFDHTKALGFAKLTIEAARRAERKGLLIKKMNPTLSGTFDRALREWQAQYKRLSKLA